MSFCNCESGLSNMGTPSCQGVASVTKKIIYVPYRGSDGVRNSIGISDILDQAYLTAKLNHVDPSKRWYTTFSPIENVEDTKAESVFESLNSGSNIFIQEGVRTFTGMYIKQSAQFLGKLKSGLCVDFGVYLIDKQGNLTGSVSKDGTELYPILVDKESFSPIMMKATDTTAAKIQVSFEFSRIELDENLRQISASAITADILGANGLLDGTIVTSADTTTSVTATISTSYGSFGSPVMVEGLELADFDLYNVTDALSVTPLTVTETSAGVYGITYAAQTLADVMRITVAKNGFDIPSVTYTI